MPEVVQTSGMDCGPASLTSLLRGFNISADYGRLREACHTDVDGTSIDTLEEIIVQLGLNGEQIMVPTDHILLPETNALPAIVVVRLPNGFTHFVLLWERHGPLLQIMDPASGRRWQSREEFLKSLYVHRMVVPADAWRDYAGGEEFMSGLQKRMSIAGVTTNSVQRLTGAALTEPTWQLLARLDAATRMTQSIIDVGGIKAGKEAEQLLTELFQYTASNKETSTKTDLIPDRYWSVRPVDSAANQEETLELRGAVLVRVLGKNIVDNSASQDSTAQEPSVEGNQKTSEQSAPDKTSLPPDLARALDAQPSRPLRFLLKHLRGDGFLTPLILLSGLLIGGSAVLLEALIFRGLLDFGTTLTLSTQRLGALGLILLLLLLLLLLELPLSALLHRFGRKLENNLLLAFMEKIPRLNDRYFQSRPVSDMAERSHTLHILRNIPLYGGELIRLVTQFLCTTLALLWLAPTSAPIVITGTLIILVLPFILEPILAERDMRMRTHRGGLARFYLDSMIGAIPIRVHGAEESMRREHESLLQEWERAGFDLYKAIVPATALQLMAGTGLVILLLYSHLAHEGTVGGVLLLSYWGLQLPLIGERIGTMIQQFPAYRSVTLRLIEPLSTPEERAERTDDRTEAETSTGKEETRKEEFTEGVSITMQDLAVAAAGNTILEDINLQIDAGQHLAVVGHSGAGKSTFVGLLLGWHTASAGDLLVDGTPLTAGNSDRLEALRRSTVWIDPAVQIWNTSLFQNILYGNNPDALSEISNAISNANLASLLEQLPDGMMTQLGEGGSFLSGGEGQRVRLARAMLNKQPRLVILDEPFRGLDRNTRRELLHRARTLWSNATLICISHDVDITQEFDRVLVIENGRLIEDDSPKDLAQRPDSRYSKLLNIDLHAEENIWPSSKWRRLEIEHGKIHVREEKQG